MRRRLGLPLVGGVIVLVGCCDARHQRTEPVAAPPAAASPTEPPAPEDTNQALLDEVNRGVWAHYRKTRPIWARRVESAESIMTLEGPEQVPAGDFICRGEAGDLWAQTEATLKKRYVATGEIEDGWERYQPHPDAEGVMAIAVDHAFTVQASWGKLQGKPGDYLLKNFADRDNPAPKDLWIVDQTLFRQTYVDVRE